MEFSVLGRGGGGVRIAHFRQWVVLVAMVFLMSPNETSSLWGKNFLRAQGADQGIWDSKPHYSSPWSLGDSR